jgi:hypothetical protein
MDKKSRSGSGMNIPDHIFFRELKNNFFVKNTLILLCGSGFGIRNLPGSGINISDPQHWLQATRQTDKLKIDNNSMFITGNE